MAKKRKKRKTKKRGGRKKNPIYKRATGRGKKTVETSLLYNTDEIVAAKKLVRKLKTQLPKIALEDRKPIRVKLAKLMKIASKKGVAYSEIEKHLAAFDSKYKALGYNVATLRLNLGEAKMIKKAAAKASKKSSKKKTKRKASKKKTKRKVSKKSKRKTSKRKTTKRKGKGGSVAKRRKKRRKAKKTKVRGRAGSKTISAKISTKSRLSKKGQSASGSWKAKGGKRFSASIKRTNPFRVSEEEGVGLQKALGDVQSLAWLGAASGTAGLLDGIVTKFVPVYANLKATAVSVAGPVAPAVPTLALATILSAVEYAVDRFVPSRFKDNAAYKGFKGYNEALATVGLIQVISGVSSMGAQFLAPMIPGLSGINYTPLGGVLYSPNMAGVVYSPNGLSGYGKHPQMGMHPQMGNSAPQMGYGADFGRYQASDYGSGAGYTEAHNRSSADFGGPDDDVVLDQSMGQMG